MRRSCVGFFLLAILGGAALLIAEAPMPQMKSVDPMTAKAGDILSVTGENLDKSTVAEVYLTDGSHDFKVVITEQAPDSLKVKIPATTKPGLSCSHGPHDGESTEIDRAAG